MSSKLREEIKGILQNHGCIECREWEDGGRNDEKAEQNLLALFERQLVEERIDEWLTILGSDFDMFYPDDKFNDMISIPSFWIAKHIAQLKANKSREES